jgi:hypothetical protein
VINPVVVVCGITKYRRFVLAKLTFFGLFKKILQTTNANTESRPPAMA